MRQTQIITAAALIAAVVAILGVFTGTINGRRMSGTVSTPWGTFNFTGKQTAGIRRFFGLARSKDASPPSPLT